MRNLLKPVLCGINGSILIMLLWLSYGRDISKNLDYIIGGGVVAMVSCVLSQIALRDKQRDLKQISKELKTHALFLKSDDMKYQSLQSAINEIQFVQSLKDKGL